MQSLILSRCISQFRTSLSRCATVNKSWSRSIGNKLGSLGQVFSNVISTIVINALVLLWWLLQAKFLLEISVVALSSPLIVVNIQSWPMIHGFICRLPTAPQTPLSRCYFDCGFTSSGRNTATKLDHQSSCCNKLPNKPTPV